MKIPCPNCRAVFGVHPSLADQPARCPRCGTTIAPSAAAPRRRTRRFFKTIVLLIISIALLRFGFVSGWRAADRRLAEAGVVEAPKKGRPHPPKPPAKVRPAELKARVAIEEAAPREEAEPVQLGKVK